MPYPKASAGSVINDSAGAAKKIKNTNQRGPFLKDPFLQRVASALLLFGILGQLEDFDVFFITGNS
jgi:hypothetical protein